MKTPYLWHRATWPLACVCVLVLSACPGIEYGFTKLGSKPCYTRTDLFEATLLPVQSSDGAEVCQLIERSGDITPDEVPLETAYQPNYFIVRGLRGSKYPAGRVRIAGWAIDEGGGVGSRPSGYSDWATPTGMDGDWAAGFWESQMGTLPTGATAHRAFFLPEIEHLDNTDCDDYPPVELYIELCDH